MRNVCNWIVAIVALWIVGIAPAHGQCPNGMCPMGGYAPMSTGFTQPYYQPQYQQSYYQPMAYGGCNGGQMAYGFQQNYYGMPSQGWSGYGVGGPAYSYAAPAFYPQQQYGYGYCQNGLFGRRGGGFTSCSW